jgi:hypothetical protein
LPGKCGRIGDLFFLHHPQGCQAFALGAKQVRHLVGDLDFSLIRAAGEGVRVKLNEDLTQRQVDQAGVLSRRVNKYTGGRPTTQFTKAHLDRTMGDLLKDTLSGDGVIIASDAGWGQFPPKFLRDHLDDSRVRNRDRIAGNRLP